MAIAARRKKISKEEAKKKRKKIYKKVDELDPKSKRLIMKYYKELEKLEKLQDRMKKIEDKLGEIAGPVADILDELSYRTVQIDDMLLYAMDRKYMSKRPQYKKALEVVMPHLSDDIKKVIEPLLEAEYSLATYIKKKPYGESFLGKIKDTASKWYEKIKTYIFKIANRIRKIFPKLDNDIAKLREITYKNESLTTAESILRRLA